MEESMAGLEGALFVEALRWPTDATLLCTVGSADEGDETSALVALDVRSGGAEVAACDVEMGLGIFEDDLTSGSRQRALTHCAAVEQWGVAVVADRRASDDHLNLVSCAWDRSAEQPSPCLLRIAEDIALARVEMVDGNDDFVVGLSMDLTRASDAVDDPRDDEAPAVPCAPLLLALRDSRIGGFPSGGCSA